MPQEYPLRRIERMWCFDELFGNPTILYHNLVPLLGLIKDTIGCRLNILAAELIPVFDRVP
jgi:hypothetical protein